ncbi:hypothetical protein BGZ95_002963 [Linnemannia exigua]|uniref:Tail specific protease domain-containing protein n=1 Tax=Linnemannia exigua TaxID=604196 RepID=A0AAD4DIC2_9FUNG|nr:hypothetical protein BGZ95_002963 [Linnemannia exigua]
MVSFTLRSLIISASLKNGVGIKYKDVADCYGAIPFNRSIAADTISTIHDLFRDYYVFTDSALTPQVPAPFMSEPVDILKQLQTIGRNNYNSDYKFHTDVRLAVDTLRDGHASYDVECYTNYAFQQRLSLYAPVENGVQFSITTSLPDKSYIDYELRCSNKPSTIRLREEWATFAQREVVFADIKSYVVNVCLKDDSAPESSGQSQSRPHLRNLAIPIKKRDLEDNGPLGAAALPTAPPRPVQQFKNAEKLVAGEATVFYHLKTQPDTGVMVVHTFVADNDDEIAVILKGLTAFHARNVTKVLVDFQGNGGGYLSLSTNLVQLLFPNEHSLDASFEADIRVTKPVQRAAALGLKKVNGGFYNSYNYVDLQAEGTPRYNSSDLFAKPVTIERNDLKTQYTEKTAIYNPPLGKDITTAVSAFPWTGRRENIRILTDGRCGSACGMASYFWTGIHGVEAYSIGGTKGEDLSMFSFAGASVINLNRLQKTYRGLKLESPLKDLAYKNEVRFSWLEVYGKNRATPLEYDAELYRSKHRLDYTLKNAHSRDVLWMEVVAAAWK